jgi:hypothetical protein
MKRAFVSLPEGAWDIIHNELKGQLGDGDSEIIRNIVIAYLSDKGYFVNDKSSTSLADLDDRIVVMEAMINTMVTVLEEKKITDSHVFENLMRKHIAKMAHEEK